MITLVDIARANGVSKAYVRKLYLQGRLTSKGAVVRTERVGKMLVFPDDTELPAVRAPYGTLPKTEAKK